MTSVPPHIPTPEDVAHYLRRFEPLWSALGVRAHLPTVEFLAKGTANAVFAFDIDAHPLVLRVGFTANTKPSIQAQVEQEAQVLSLLQGHQITPKIWAADLTTSNPLGKPSIVMERLLGRELDYRDEDLALVGALHAKLHALDLIPSHVEQYPDLVTHLLAQASEWLATYATWQGVNQDSLDLLQGAHERINAQPRHTSPPVLVHGDSTYWNYMIEPKGARLIDWDWCKRTTAYLDSSHFLSPITTLRCDETLLTASQENIYIESYVDASPKELSVAQFRDQLDQLRPAVILHSACWTACWISQTQPVERHDVNFDALIPKQALKQIAPEFLHHLIQQGLL